MTVIICCDGRTDLLARTLESVRRQTLTGLTVVLTGNAPTAEELTRIVRAPSDASGRQVAVRPSAGAGSAVARNEAIVAAQSRFVMELREGDWIEPTAIEKAAWALETTPGACLVILKESSASDGQREFGPIERAELASGWLELGSYMLRTEAWRRAGGFDLRAPADAADQDLLIRMIGQGWAVQRIPESLTHLRPTVMPSDAAERTAALRWLRARHRRFYVRGAVARRTERAGATLRRRFPILPAIPRWIRRKLEVEGLTDRRRAIRHPLNTTLRLMPRPMKGRLWRRLNLPARPELWSYEPRLVTLPASRPTQVAARQAQAQAQAPARKTHLLVIHHYVTIGGADAVILNLLSGIDRDLFDVHLITTDREPDGDLKRLPLSKFAAQTDSIYQLPQFLNKDLFLRFLIDFINARQIDVVLVSLSIFAYQALPQLRAACLNTAFVDLLHAEAPYAPMDQIRLASRYRRFLDRRVVTTEAVREAQIARYGESADRVAIIPNGIDTTGYFNPEACVRGAFRNELGIGEEVAIVLYFGRMSAEKQPMHVVAVAEYLRERPDIAFVLLGDGPQTVPAAKAISERGLSNVHLRPTRDDHRPVIADADLVMFPSQREGLSIAGLESMAMGKPIVASRVPGWTDLIEDGVDGFLVEDGDIAGYAAAITRLVDDPALRGRISEAGRDRATRNYDLRKVVAAWEQLLDTVAAPTPDGST